MKNRRVELGILTRGSLCLTTVAVLISLLLVPGYAFDGNRKGFVAGFGMGYSPTTKLSMSNDLLGWTENGFAGNGLIGYAWDSSNMLVYEGNGSVYKASSPGNPWILQGLDAVRWYHYWGKSEKRLFTVVGAGMMIFDTQYCDLNGRGFGASAGFGYELIKQIQIGVYVTSGQTSHDSGVTATHTMITMLITLVAY